MVASHHISLFCDLAEIGARKVGQNNTVGLDSTVSEPFPPSTEPPTLGDLKRIEGVCPKMPGLFQQVRIATFAELAGADVSPVEEILRNANIT